MDDSREIILITNGSSLDVEKGDVTLPLNESEVKVDSIKEADDNYRQIQIFLSEINELKSLFTNSLRDITHEFLNGQKEIVSTIIQNRQDFEEEISAIKGRILKIEDQVQENKKTIVKIDDNHKCDITQTNNGDKGTQERPGAGLAFPTLINQSTQEIEKQQQNTDTHFLLNQDNAFNSNQNHTVLDNLQVNRGLSSNVNLRERRNVSLKPQLYEGDEDLDEYLSQFVILAEINGWDYVTKSLYLAGSLKGEQELYSMN